MLLVHSLDRLHTFCEVERVDVLYELCPVSVPPLVVMGPIIWLVVLGDARVMEVVGGVDRVDDTGTSRGASEGIILTVPVHT